MRGAVFVVNELISLPVGSDKVMHACFGIVEEFIAIARQRARCVMDDHQVDLFRPFRRRCSRPHPRWLNSHLDLLTGELYPFLRRGGPHFPALDSDGTLPGAP